MKFKVIEVDRYHDEHLIESTLCYTDADDEIEDEEILIECLEMLI